MTDSTAGIQIGCQAVAGKQLPSRLGQSLILLSWGTLLFSRCGFVKMGPLCSNMHRDACKFLILLLDCIATAWQTHFLKGAGCLKLLMPGRYKRLAWRLAVFHLMSLAGS